MYFLIAILIGQDPARYDGAGFGNVSQRTEPQEGIFVITATQTGGIPKLNPHEHYALVTAYDLTANCVEALDYMAPSSEAMIHAAVYDCNSSVQAVFHAHTPYIWEATEVLEIPATKPDVEYGTPAMAREVERLLRETDVRAKGIFSMLGHQDGIMTFGSTPQEAGKIILAYLAKALDLQ